MSQFWNYLKWVNFSIEFSWHVYLLDDVEINTDMICSHGFRRLVPNSLNSCLINKLFLFFPFYGLRSFLNGLMFPEVVF
jgi:hypothetical protein